MATVWELVTSSSNLPEENDFWDHLNNLGSGAYSGVVLLNGLEIEMNDACVDVELAPTSYELEVEDAGVEIEVEIDEYEIEVC